MIDGWFSLLIFSFITAVGGLAALLIQSFRGEPGKVLQHSGEPLALPVPATDGVSILRSSTMLAYRPAVRCLNLLSPSIEIAPKPSSYAKSPRSAPSDRVLAPRGP